MSFFASRGLVASLPLPLSVITPHYSLARCHCQCQTRPQSLPPSPPLETARWDIKKDQKGGGGRGGKGEAPPALPPLQPRFLTRLNSCPWAGTNDTSTNAGSGSVRRPGRRSCCLPSPAPALATAQRSLGRPLKNILTDFASICLLNPPLFILQRDLGTRLLTRLSAQF